MIQQTKITIKFQPPVVMISRVQTQTNSYFELQKNVKSRSKLKLSTIDMCVLAWAKKKKIGFGFRPLQGSFRVVRRAQKTSFKFIDP